jgi:hypothetical protein
MAIPPAARKNARRLTVHRFRFGTMLTTRLRLES